MGHWQQEYGGRGEEVGGRGDAREAREHGVMAEIDESLQRLERTRQDGKITPDEFEEVRHVLELQRRHVGTEPLN